jgi:alkylated DNA repair dioxygenase AlkB
MPDWLNLLGERLQQAAVINFKPDQAIVNEYIENQGIAAHTDCEPCFADTILSVSLGGSCVMDFSRNGENVPLLIEPRTLLEMKGDARYEWQHGIAARKTDKFNGKTCLRQRRVSVTFRKVVLP